MELPQFIGRLVLEAMSTCSAVPTLMSNYFDPLSTLCKIVSVRRRRRCLRRFARAGGERLGGRNNFPGLGLAASIRL